MIKSRPAAVRQHERWETKTHLLNQGLAHKRLATFQIRHHGRRARVPVGPLCISKTTDRADYTAGVNDSSVLRLPPKQELTPQDVMSVFGYARNLQHKYDLGKVLGAGSFGVVREAIYKSSGRKYACKTIPKVPKRGNSTPRYLLKIQTEVDVMQQLGPSLDSVFLKDVFEDDENVHLVMELCSGGPILERVKAGKMSERDVATIIRSVLRFIAQCHSRGIIYRDVKPDNFLFLTNEPDSPIRATDFGLSIRLWQEEGKLKSRSGTPVYMAPEVIMQDYAHSADIWSVGMLMYQLLTGTFPFWDNVQNVSLQQVWQAILTKKVDFTTRGLKAQVSENARDLLKKLLERDPEKRIAAVDALEHPWIKDPTLSSADPLDGSVVQRLQRYATYGHLKQLVLRLISSDMNNDSGACPVDGIDHLRDLFKVIDTRLLWRNQHSGADGRPAKARLPHQRERGGAAHGPYRYEPRRRHCAGRVCCLPPGLEHGDFKGRMLEQLGGHGFQPSGCEPRWLHLAG
eukprot:jgi/Botrbrau1/7276/Bobra.0318s0014.1